MSYLPASKMKVWSKNSVTGFCNTLFHCVVQCWQTINKIPLFHCTNRPMAFCKNYQESKPSDMYFAGLFFLSCGGGQLDHKPLHNNSRPIQLNSTNQMQGCLQGQIKHIFKIHYQCGYFVYFFYIISFLRLYKEKTTFKLEIGFETSVSCI